MIAVMMIGPLFHSQFFHCFWYGGGDCLLYFLLRSSSSAHPFFLDFLLWLMYFLKLPLGKKCPSVLLVFSRNKMKEKKQSKRVKSI